MLDVASKQQKSNFNLSQRTCTKCSKYEYIIQYLNV